MTDHEGPDHGGHDHGGHDHGEHDHGEAEREAALHGILDRYAAAWGAGDLESILAAWHTPCATYADGVQAPVADEDAKRRHFGGLLERYRAAGVTGPEMTGFDVVDLGRNSALVTVRWTSRRADGTTAADYLDSYHFGRVGEAWKILDDTVHD
jgi:hypothetical protein